MSPKISWFIFYTISQPIKFHGTCFYGPHTIPLVPGAFQPQLSIKSIEQKYINIWYFDVI